MDERLYSASVIGDVSALAELMKEGRPGFLEQVTPSLSNTCLHMCAYFGHTHFAEEVLRLQPELASAKNIWSETPLHIACREGKAETVRVLLEANPFVACCALLSSADEGANAMMLAARYGSVEVAKLILSDRLLPLFKLDGSLVRSLCDAADRGYAGIVKEILMVEPRACIVVDEKLSTPLHVAARKGHVQVVEELVRHHRIYETCWKLDKEGRTPLHLAADRGSTEIMLAILSADPSIASDSTLINKGDQKGNTVLHLAAYNASPEMLSYITSNTRVDVNVLNDAGLTALEIVKRVKNHSARSQMISTLIDAELRNTNTAAQMKHEDEKRYRGIHRERLQNAQNTIAVVAVLIATVTFSAGLAPPGGLHQEGDFAGRPIMAETKIFKVFMASNNMALFTSLAIVIVLVSIIPIRQQAQTRLVSVTGRMMWISVLFMVVAYTSGSWITCSTNKGNRLTMEVTYGLGLGMLGLVVIALLVMMIKEWVNKPKLNEQRGNERQRLVTMKPTEEQANKWQSEARRDNRLEQRIEQLRFHKVDPNSPRLPFWIVDRGFSVC